MKSKALLGVLLFAAVGILASLGQTLQRPPAPPEQPLPFSHKVHAGQLKLECKTCHRNPDPGKMMTFAPTATCMQCHSMTAADKPSIQKLAEFDQKKQPIQWARVYETPRYVIFSHRAHLAAGSACADCHGQVKERDQLFREGDISMKGCVDCHFSKQASTDCTYCHEKLN